MNRDFFLKIVCHSNIRMQDALRRKCQIWRKIRLSERRIAQLRRWSTELPVAERREEAVWVGGRKGEGGVERHCDSKSERETGRESDIRGSIPPPAVEYLDVFIAALLHFYFVILSRSKLLLHIIHPFHYRLPHDDLKVGCKCA